MSKYTFILFFITLQAAAQNLFTVSLDKQHLSSDSVPLKVSEIIDGRKDKNVVGVVQLGLNNRKEFAVFEKPALQEVYDLFDRSHLLTASGQAIAIRVNHLYISELTLALSETGKAELSLDFFAKENEDTYLYMASVYVSEENNGLDVTSKHPENIVKAFKKALIRFASHERKADGQMVFTREDLLNPDLVFRDASSMPVVQAREYKDGFYTTFEEFVNNTPSVDINCKMKMGNKIKMKCSEGDEEMYLNIYGFAKDNQLYVLFHQRFYPMEKKKNDFYFVGPRMPGRTSEYTKGWIMAGALGGMIASNAAAYNVVYKIDLTTGGIKAVNGIY